MLIQVALSHLSLVIQTKVGQLDAKVASCHHELCPGVQYLLGGKISFLTMESCQFNPDTNCIVLGGNMCPIVPPVVS